jgi:hypothetical protein
LTTTSLHQNKTKSITTETKLDPSPPPLTPKADPAPPKLPPHHLTTSSLSKTPIVAKTIQNPRDYVIKT